MSAQSIRGGAGNFPTSGLIILAGGAKIVYIEVELLKCLREESTIF